MSKHTITLRKDLRAERLFIGERQIAVIYDDYGETIVRAVNCHDELVMMLERLIEVNGLDGDESDAKECWISLLARARGES